MSSAKHFSLMRRLTRVGLAACLGISVLVFLAGNPDSLPGRLLIFGCLCAALLFAVSQIPAFSRLSLHADGISIRTPFWRQELGWENVKRFTLVDFDNTGIGITPDWARYSVGLVVSDERLTGLPRLLLRLNQKYGCDFTIPAVDGVHPHDLFALLKQAHAEARRGYRETEAEAA